MKMRFERPGSLIKRRGASLLLLLLTVMLAACSSDSNEFPEHDNTEEVLAYYAANPDRFSFKTPADIPADLLWEDGMDQPDLGSPEAKKGGTQYHFMQDFPRTLRWLGPEATGGFRAYILDNVTMALGHEHPDTLEFYPGIASAWAIENDSNTVYVKINPEARYSDGEPITVDDFMFMFFFMLSDYIVEPWYNNFYSERYANITKYDDHTLSVTMSAGKPDMLLYALDMRPIPQHIYKDLGDDFIDRYQWRSVASTSPYIIKQEDVINGRSITLTRDENWWAKDNKYFANRFNPDRIVFSVVRDANNRFEGFKRGDFDQFGLDLAEFWYDKLPDSDPDVSNGYIHKSIFYNQRPRPNYGLWINTSRPLLDNKDVRTGIHYASNWGLVIESFFRGDSRRMNTARDGFPEFTHPTLRARSFDIEKAQEHFAKAGFTRRGPDGILVNEQGQRLAFTLNTGYEALGDILTILREEAAKAGVEFRIEILDSTAGWQKVQEKQHDITFSAFAVSAEMYPRFWELYHSSNAYDNAFLPDGSVNPDRTVKVQTNNLELVASRELDAMIEQYDASSDYNEMLELSHRIDEFLYDNASFVPGYVQDFFRMGHWRWMRYPEGFSHMRTTLSGSFDDLFVHWIDTDLKEETLAARRDGRTFEQQIRVYDQFRVVP
jgi:microcin C transport system substrate-binding protein